MTARKGVGLKGSPRSYCGNRLKDEVYRQMFRLEESRPGAEVGLSLALLRAWVSTDTEPKGSEEWDWLKRISPLCLQMIEDSLQKLDTMRDRMP